MSDSNVTPLGTFLRLDPSVRKRTLARSATPGAWLAIALACSALLWVLASCGGPRVPRHLVIISMDTARADHFGFYGSRVVRTPRLDSLAHESIVFDDYMVSAPSTLASHTSLFTGKYPLHHGTPRNGFMVNRENQMLAEILKRAGFQTAGFVGSFALDSRFDFNQGFDEYDEDLDVLVGDQGADQNQRSATHVTDAVLRYLNGREGLSQLGGYVDTESKRLGARGTAVPRHLFLFAHYFDAHQPYAPPAPYDTLYDPAGRKGLGTILAWKTNTDMPPDQKRQIGQRFAKQYAGEISYVDEQVGRLLDELRARGILDDALLVVVNDHGESLDERAVTFEHGPEVYQSTVRGVCMMRLPHAERGGTRWAALQSNVDVLPTILRYFRIATPAGIDGEAIDLRADGASVPDRTRFSQATKPWEPVETDPRWTNMNKARCIRQGRLKFIQTPWQNEEELYDLASDPGETKNLLLDPSKQDQANAAALRQKLEHWAASATPLPSRFETAQREETIRRLRSLGYIK